MLQGTLIIQLYLYYSANGKDPILLKIVVYGTFLLATIQTLFATTETWDTLVVNWGNPNVIAHPFWAGGVLPMLSGFPSACNRSSPESVHTCRFIGAMLTRATASDSDHVSPASG
ncbi:hypothetical protein B0H11DRAFT_2235978 [Mycena galericulata]|nr:hypothetical protein B0H11DRAFT_2235978 [Mycena galericulata]